MLRAALLNSVTMTQFLKCRAVELEHEEHHGFLLHEPSSPPLAPLQTPWHLRSFLPGAQGATGRGKGRCPHADRLGPALSWEA